MGGSSAARIQTDESTGIALSAGGLVLNLPPSMSWAQLQAPPRAVQLLQRSLARGRLAHAYLFTGDHPPALEDAARALAKTINCQSPKERGVTGLGLESCDQCASCHAIEASGHPDVHWVRPESKSRAITIDQMRAMMATVHLKPTSAEYKVGIIVAADRLNEPSANAFLKTLEEPPPKSVLILLSTEPQRLLETILSRCQRLNFGGETGSGVAALETGWLKSFSELAASERTSLLQRYHLLGMLLHQLAQLKTEIEQRLTARSPLEIHTEADANLREKWEEELAAAIEAEYRRQRGDVLRGLQRWLRDVWLQSLALPEDVLTFAALKEDTRVIARRIPAAQAAHNLQVIEDSQRLLASNVQEPLALEVGLLQLKL